MSEVENFQKVVGSILCRNPEGMIGGKTCKYRNPLKELTKAYKNTFQALRAIETPRYGNPERKSNKIKCMSKST